MQEAHGDGVEALGARRPAPRPRRGRGDQDVAAGVHALAQGEAGVAGDQRLGQDEVEVVLLEAAFGPHLDHVAEALGRDEGGAGAAPLDQGVGGERGAVDDAGEGGRRECRPWRRPAACRRGSRPRARRRWSAPWWRRDAPPVSSTTSVKVPPMSTPRRAPIMDMALAPPLPDWAKIGTVNPCRRIIIFYAI